MLILNQEDKDNKHEKELPNIGEQVVEEKNKINKAKNMGANEPKFSSIRLIPVPNSSNSLTNSLELPPE